MLSDLYYARIFLNFDVIGKDNVIYICLFYNIEEVSIYGL